MDIIKLKEFNLFLKLLDRKRIALPKKKYLTQDFQFKIKEIAHKQKKRRILNSWTFQEFFVNGRPLHSILDQFFYANTDSLLGDNVGILGYGYFDAKEFELVSIKRLLLQDITDEDLKVLGLDREDFEKESFLIYQCSHCGDYLCGGVGVDIQKTEQGFSWSFHGEDKVLTFNFGEKQYREVFNNYKRQIEQEIARV